MRLGYGFRHLFILGHGLGHFGTRQARGDAIDANRRRQFGCQGHCQSFHPCFGGSNNGVICQTMAGSDTAE